MDFSSPTVQYIPHVEMESRITPVVFSAFNDVIWCGIAMYCFHPIFIVIDKIHLFIDFKVSMHTEVKTISMIIYCAVNVLRVQLTSVDPPKIFIGIGDRELSIKQCSMVLILTNNVDYQFSNSSY